MPSVMEARLRVLTPSCWDKLAVKVLYDKRLAIGRVRKDALPVIREILREYENAGDPCIARHTIGPSIAIGESAVAKYRFVR